MNIWLVQNTVLFLQLFSLCLTQTLETEDSCPLKLGNKCIVNLHGKSGDGYYTEVVVGTPPQKLNALIDTGSSNVAIAAAPNPSISKFYNRSASTSLRPLHVSVDVPYSQGSWCGDLVNDTVRLSDTNAPAVFCDVALIQRSKNFYINGSEWQGIVGLAYRQLALPNASVTTWPEAAQQALHGQLSTMSVLLCGPQPGTGGRHHGYIEFGHTRQELLTGHFRSAAIFRPWFFETIITNMTVGGRRLPLACVDFNTDKTIVDTGTTNLRLPQKVFSAVVPLLQEAAPLVEPSHAFWTGKASVCLPAANSSALFALLPNVTLSLQTDRTTAFDLTITALSYVREVFVDSAASLEARCFTLGIDSSTTGTVLGVVVLEGLYVRFNLHLNTVELAPAVCGPEVTLHGPYTSADSTDCGYKPRSAYSRTVHVAMYVIGGMLALICVPLLMASVSCLRSRPWRRPPGRDNFSLLVDFPE